MTESFLTSYVGLFELELDERLVREVEVPLIQRDYAQGRQDPRTTLIRSTFLDVLHDAATGGEPVGLDFVYGEVEDDTLHPLDGQQRLTVLFLLHWYVAARTGRIDAAATWTSFSYATRPSARLFCQRLATADLPDDVSPSAWITDQAWYLRTWVHDPTVQSMLVVLDDIHNRFASNDLDAVWRRLTRPDKPAISFHVLPISDMGAAEELYIKMNSRGRPLTEFENFKALFERVIEHHDRADEFSRKVDGEWSNLLWPLHGGDNLIDDEFLRYFEFVMEICEWRTGRVGASRDRLLARAEQTFGTDDGAADNLDFLFHAFDTWGDDTSTDAYFERIFTSDTNDTDGGQHRTLLFGTDAQPNLFKQCLRDFGNDQRFGIARRMLLYAVLLDRRHRVADLAQRIRSLRNLLEASTDEIRPANMPRIVEDVRALIVDGDLDQVGVLNAAQREDETAKWAFTARHAEHTPSLERLEDDQQLRGSLMAFDLDPGRFEDRLNAWAALRASSDLTMTLSGALLATGLYHRTIGKTMQFGPPSWSTRWRNLLTGTTRPSMQPTRDTLMAVLDTVAESDGAAMDALDAVVQGFLDRAEAVERFDWRFYLVKYPEMRIGASGIYRADDDQMGYSVCMLEKTQLNSYYRDPFLVAVVRRGQLQDEVVDGEHGPYFYGQAENPRWLRLRASGLGLRCISTGFAVQPPDDAANLRLFHEFIEERVDVSVVDEHHQLVVPQVEAQGERIDTANRVHIGAEFLTACVQAGL